MNSFSETSFVILVDHLTKLVSVVFLHSSTITLPFEKASVLFEEFKIAGNNFLYKVE